MRKTDSWLRHLVYACLPASEPTGPHQVGRRLNRPRRRALAPPTDKHTEPELTSLLSELIDWGNQLRRQMNVGRRANERALKTETIDWLRSAEALTRRMWPATPVKVIPGLDTESNLFRMLIAHQLSDLEHLKENWLPAALARPTVDARSCQHRRVDTAKDRKRRSPE